MAFLSFWGHLGPFGANNICICVFAKLWHVLEKCICICIICEAFYLSVFVFANKWDMQLFVVTVGAKFYLLQALKSCKKKVDQTLHLNCKNGLENRL